MSKTRTYSFKEYNRVPGMVDLSLNPVGVGGHVVPGPPGQVSRPQPTGGPLPPLPHQQQQLQQPQQTWFEPARGNSNTGGTGIWAGGKSTAIVCELEFLYTCMTSKCSISGHDFINICIVTLKWLKTITIGIKTKP